MPAEIDFSVFDTPAIRDVLKCKAHLLRAGIPADYAAIEILSIIVDDYRRKVGLSAYLSQMLGDLATVPIQECALYWENGERIEASGGQPVQQFIRRRFGGGILPFRVKVGEQERYL